MKCRSVKDRISAAVWRSAISGQDPRPAAAVGQREVGDVADPGRTDRSPALGQLGEQQEHEQDGLEHGHHQRG
jgi:hypothetical protein